MWKIKITLEGNLTHELGDVRSGRPGWAECNPSKITKMVFPFIGKIDGKDIPLELILSGMEKYNFFVEAMRGVGKNATMVKGLWFLGKIPFEDKVVGFVVKDSCKIVNAVYGKEYNGFSTVGWKTGTVGDKVVSVMRGIGK
jgi:hypothetical protein